jgi:diguanylate cyclase (GGDEF)-like protein
VAPVAEDIAAPESPAEVQPARAARPEPEPLYEPEPEPEPPAAVEALQPEQAQTEPQAAEEIQPPPMPEGMVTGTPIRGESAGAEIGNVSETQVDTAYRSHLDSKRRDIQKLQATLAKQVLETIAQNEEFGVLLEVVLGELRQAGDGREMEDLRWTLIREIEKLTKGHHELAEKLDSTHHYLQLIESDSRQLSDELTRVRLLSLTDELTGLPNRRAFLRRIEDEVARVQRYGFPLSLALIDLDHFKQINDKHGHAGGDEVLQIYSKNILSIFRHHDLVARYGGEEFAVLLPNTDAEGSMRALTKVRNRALETRWQANGEMIPVPTFSAGVSLYKPGETASAFIERADKALYRAKRLGRNRVEEDATYKEPETPGKEPERKQRGES